MANADAPRVVFNTQLMAEDLALKGWNTAELAKRAEVSDMTAYRFLSGERQTAKSAKKLARALGRSVARYMVRQEAVA